MVLSDVIFRGYFRQRTVCFLSYVVDFLSKIAKSSCSRLFSKQKNGNLLAAESFVATFVRTLWQRQFFLPKIFVPNGFKWLYGKMLSVVIFSNQFSVGTGHVLFPDAQDNFYGQSAAWSL